MSLILDNVSVTRSGRRILSDVTMTVEAGSFLAICGPNGAGKSTALALMDGSLPPNSGRVLLDGRLLTHYRGRELARMRAVVPQRHHLSFPFLVHEVVAMGRSPHHGATGPQHDAAICSVVMDLMAVTPLAERNYLTLSGGERQRVMIARALAQVWEAPATAPRILLLDEPTAALDLKHQIALMKLLRRLASDGWAIAAVLHDLPLVRTWCTNVSMLSGGSVVRSGAPSDILDPETIAEVFDLDEPYELTPASSGCGGSGGVSQSIAK